MTDALPEFDWSMDRGRAAMRGFWRMALALLPGGVVGLCAFRLPWQLIRIQQEASYYALALLMFVLAGVALLTLLSAARWLLLAGWPGRLGVRIDPDRIIVESGPWGRREFDWARIHIRAPMELDADTLAAVPPDRLAVELRHPAAAGDVVTMLSIFTGQEAETIVAALRPYLVRALARRE